MNDVTIYDNHFNGNEWFVIAMTQSLFNLLIGVVFGLMFDHTIGIPPFDFYG